MNNYTNRRKRQLIEALLLNESSVMIHLYAKHEKVICPSYLKNNPQTVFQVGYNMPVPITDLTIEDEGWSGTLSFKGQGYWCYVPWEAVFAVALDSREIVAAWDIPPELLLDEPLEPMLDFSRKAPEDLPEGVTSLAEYRSQRATRAPQKPVQSDSEDEQSKPKIKLRPPLKPRKPRPWYVRLVNDKPE